MGDIASSQNYEKKEYINVPFSVKAFKDEDPEYFYFEGYASTFGNVDSYDDVVVQGAFTKTIQQNPNFKIFWQHASDMPLGVPDYASEDSKGLFIKCKLPKSDSFVRDRVIPQMKVGSIDRMSIGYAATKCSYKMDNGAQLRMLEEVKLYEVSLVSIPANDQATVTGFKSAQLDEAKGLKDIEGFLKDAGMSAKTAKTLISKIKEFSPRDEGEIEQQRDAVACPNDLQSILDEIKTTTLLINLKSI